MLVKTLQTNDIIDRNVHLRIIRRETSDGLSELESGDITTENGDHLALSANDIRQLVKLFSMAEDKGLCI